MTGINGGVKVSSTMVLNHRGQTVQVSNCAIISVLVLIGTVRFPMIRYPSLNVSGVRTLGWCVGGDR